MKARPCPVIITRKPRKRSRRSRIQSRSIYQTMCSNSRILIMTLRKSMMRVNWFHLMWLWGDELQGTWHSQFALEMEGHWKEEIWVKLGIQFLGWQAFWKHDHDVINYGHSFVQSLVQKEKKKRKIFFFFILNVVIFFFLVFWESFLLWQKRKFGIRKWFTCPLMGLRVILFFSLENWCCCLQGFVWLEIYVCRRLQLGGSGFFYCMTFVLQHCWDFGHTWTWTASLQIESASFPCT